MKTILILLALLTFPITDTIFGQESTTVKLLPTDDAFVVTDHNDPNDIRGFGDLHTGDEDFLKIWYAWNTTERNEKINSGIYLKFDISDLEASEIQNAQLKLKPYIIMVEADREILIIMVPDNDWTESNLAYNTRPFTEATVIDSVKITKTDEWYNWDVTSIVKDNAGDEVSFGLVIETLFLNTEEQIVFYSKEAEDSSDSPYLEITYTGTLAPTINTADFESGDVRFPIIVGGLVAAVIGVGILFYLIKQNKKSRVELVEYISEPKVTRIKQRLSFVDPTKGPKHYIKRYLNEPKYKEWFDRKYPNYKIYKAIGISEIEYLKIRNELEQSE